MSLVKLLFKYFFDPSFREMVDAIVSTSRNEMENLAKMRAKMRVVQQSVERKIMDLRNIVSLLQNVPGSQMLVSRLHKLISDLQDDVKDLN